MRIYCDTNIYLDVLQGREPFQEYALQVFRRVRDGELELVISDHLLWQIRQHVGWEAIANLFDDAMMTVLTTQQDIRLARQRSATRDYEDALHCILAQKGGAHVFVTRDARLSCGGLQTRHPKDL